MDHRVYSEKEVAELLRRTAELQKRMGTAGSQSGLTLDELESVAVESGLDPTLLRLAASEMPGSGPGGLVLSSDGTQTHNLVDRFLSGPISEEAWEDAVALLRYRYDTDLGRAFGMPHYGVSSADSNGRTREWRHTSMSGVETRLIIRPAAGGHHLQMSQRVGWSRPSVESSVFGSVLAVVITSLVFAATRVPLIALSTFLLTLIASIGMIYVLDKKRRSKKHRQLEEVADRVILSLGAGKERAEPARLRTEASESVGRVDKSILDDAARGDEVGESVDGEPRNRSRL